MNWWVHALVILVFLWHIPSAIVPIVTIPVSVLLAFIPLWFMGVTVNIMSLAGIAISIGVLVDGAIVEVENAYKKLELWQEGGRKGDFHAVRLEALLEVSYAWGYQDTRQKLRDLYDKVVAGQRLEP